MEIPQDLRDLYRHWGKHVDKSEQLVGKQTGEMDFDAILLQQMVVFARERMLVWEKKQLGLIQPWTNDPVIGNYRFCNIYRELDRQTIEYHCLLAGLREDFELWLLNMFFCRMICRTETVRRVGLIDFDRNNNQLVYEKLMVLDKPRFGNAYVFPVSTILGGEYPTREVFLCFYLPKVMKKMASLIWKFREMNICEALEKILPLFGVRLHFLWTEVLIDTAYQYPDLLDLFGLFPVGPGSKPTMKRLSACIAPEKVNLNLTRHRVENFPYLTMEGRLVGFSAENWEGIGCEFRKYSNLSMGKGRKRKYST